MTKQVWVVWPAVSPERSLPNIKKWQKMGYFVAVLINPPSVPDDYPGADRVICQRDWSGFSTAVNILCKETPGDVVAVVGDDISPDPNLIAQEVAQEFIEHYPSLYGVMQPTGDKWAHTHLCAVSPWIGRAFIEQAYGGKGPFWGEYYHYFSDQELQEYAIQEKAFYQRDDIVQYHDHWQRQDQPKRPKYLRKAKQQWQADKDLFEQRKQQGFPSCPSKV